MSKFRDWCFTLNNYTADEYAALVSFEGHKQIRYLIFGREQGEEQKTPHLQGYIYFHNAKTFDQTVKFLGKRFHIEHAKGTYEENKAYCSKDLDFKEFGEAPDKKGKRNDIQKVKEMVKEGKSLREIYEQATSYQSIRMAEVGIRLQPLKERNPPEVKWYHGGTGSGKTRQAYAELGYDNTWVNSNTLQWFDGYDGQENVIIDDFRANQCTFAFLLRLLDRYPMKVPVKGGFVNWNPSRIIITSSQSPDLVYTDEKIREDIGQLIRRISVVKEFKKCLL